MKTNLVKEFQVPLVPASGAQSWGNSLGQNIKLIKTHMQKLHTTYFGQPLIDEPVDKPKIF